MARACKYPATDRAAPEMIGKASRMPLAMAKPTPAPALDAVDTTAAGGTQAGVGTGIGAGTAPATVAVADTVACATVTADATTAGNIQKST